MKKEPKSKIKNDYLMPDIHKFFKIVFNEDISSSIFSSILKLFNQKLIKELYTGSYFHLPYKLGDLYIRKYKPVIKIDSDGNIVMRTQKAIDYKATNQLWKDYPELEHKQRVYYDNFHTDGYKFKFMWKRYHLGKKFKMYNIYIAKDTQRNFAKYLRNHPNQSYYGK